MPLPSLSRRLFVPVALVLFGSGVCVGRAIPRAERASTVRHRSGTPIAVELTRAGPAGPVERTKKLKPAARPQNAAPAASARLSARKIARRALASTVFLRGGHVYGAGVLLDGNGHVLTCDHVIDGLKHVRAWFYDESKPVGVKIIARDHAVDLALLKLATPPTHPPATLGTVTHVAMGDEVFAMGAPMKMAFSLSHGVVSYMGRSFDGTAYVQTDLPANAGSSGGPVLNRQGELIGVSSFILRGSQGLTFFVPIDYAYQRFSAQLGMKRDNSRFESWLDARKPDPAPGRTG